MINNDFPIERIPQSFILAANELRAAMERAQAMREAVDGVKSRVLETFELRDDEGQRITDPARDWRGENWDAYRARVDKALREAGIKTDDMPFSHCPALIAEREQLLAELSLFDEAIEFSELGMTRKELNNRLLCRPDGLAFRQRFIDACLGLAQAIQEET